MCPVLRACHHRRILVLHSPPDILISFGLSFHIWPTQSHTHTHFFPFDGLMYQLDSTRGIDIFREFLVLDAQWPLNDPASGGV